MSITAPVWTCPQAFIAAETPDEPAFLYAPSAATATAERFLDGFPGLVTYAVKSNPAPQVLLALIGAGLRGFDVASPAEIEMIRRLCPEAALHYHNPIKSRAELAFAVAHGVRAYAVDSAAELAKIAETVAPDAVEGGVELSIRFRLPVKGGVYDFGAKFGASEDKAAELLAEAARRGYVPSLSFHPGTQCESPDAFVRYIEAAGRIAAAAGVTIARLNVGGGFPAHRQAAPAPLETFFAAIDEAAQRTFGDARPALVCEPGRAMVGDCMALVTRVKLVREDGAVFLNDGVYGGLAEAPVLGSATRAEVFDGNGEPRRGARRGRVVFGPTCDSVDRLPGEPLLPAAIREGDFVVFQGLGAYGGATVTAFNGYGPRRTELVEFLAA
ncbi:type III PLP-dependent enzyme [Rhodovulum sp. DZ06]|uniref:type III PLP-dependent enzyme n=1 Tax=Rhodovulum sp. DZ06 TaxID=3425126 RepID=UPI003D34AB72